MLSSAAGWHLRHGLDFYRIDTDHTQYPYAPFLIFFHALGNWLSETIPFFTFSFYLKLFLLVCLFGIAAIITKTSSDRNAGRIASLQLLTSPITYMVVLFHGQTDVVLLYFFISGSYLFSKKQFPTYQGALLYAASVATKTWSIFLLPLVLVSMKRRIDQLAVLLILGLLFFVDIFVYTRLVGSSFRIVVPALLSAGGPIGVWGITYLLGIYTLIPVYKLIWVAGGLLVLYGLLTIRKYSFWFNCLLLIFGFYIITPNWGVQYLFWCLPFIYLLRTKIPSLMYRVLTILGSSFLAVNYVSIAAGKQLSPITFTKGLGFMLWVFILFAWVRLYKDTSIQQTVTTPL
jgi:hypothetical protein